MFLLSQKLSSVFFVNYDVHYCSSVPVMFIAKFVLLLPTQVVFVSNTEKLQKISDLEEYATKHTILLFSRHQ